MSDNGIIRRAATINIGNEFARVEVTKVWTPNGERLEIVAPRLGHSICLDPMILESLTWQRPEHLSRFLEEPLGPS